MNRLGLILLALFANLTSAEVLLSDGRLWQRAAGLLSGQNGLALQSTYSRQENHFDQRGRPLAFARRSRDSQINASEKFARQDVNLKATWAYGLTSWWSLGFEVPLTYRQTEFSDFKQNEWLWQDIHLRTQIRMIKRYQWTWAIRPSAKIPTARTAPITNEMPLSDDDGQLDFGISSLIDYRMRRALIGLKMGYVVQMPDEIRTELNQSRSALPSGSRDPQIQRDLGDWLWLAVDGEWRLNRKTSMNVEYGYFYKNEDRYSGENMNLLSIPQAGVQEVHQSRLKLLYQLVDSNKSWLEDKWLLSVGYTHPWAGRNVANSGHAALELISYF